MSRVYREAIVKDICEVIKLKNILASNFDVIVLADLYNAIDKLKSHLDSTEIGDTIPDIRILPKTTWD